MLDASTAGGVTSFSMDWPSERSDGITVRSDDLTLLEALSKNTPDVEEKLRNLKLIFDDNRGEKIDRFTQEETAPFCGVDELV